MGTAGGGDTDGQLALLIKAKCSLKKELSSSLVPLSLLAMQVTYNYIVGTTQCGALCGTNAARQTGCCLLLFMTWMTGCHKVVWI